LQRKFCPSAPFSKTIGPKSLGKKNSLSLMGFLYQIWPRGTRVPRKSKLMNAVPWGVERRWGGQPNRYNFFLSFARKSESLKQKT
jgi:hypothetical protein